MITSNQGFALGTYSGATLNQSFTALSSGYLVLAVSREVPNDATEVGLETPTGFTKLSEEIIGSSWNKAAQGLYIKECANQEQISLSLPPDSRLSSLSGVNGDMLGIFVSGADSYIYDATTNGQTSFKKEGVYCSVYIGSSPFDSFRKNGIPDMYTTRYGMYSNGEPIGLLGGISPYKSRGIEFISTESDGFISYEIKFIDADTVIDKPKLGTIIRNGIHYGPEASKIIPTYNGTFINDFRIKYVNNNIDKDIVKFTIPLKSTSSEYTDDYPTIEVGMANITFPDGFRNIMTEDSLPSTTASGQNLLIGGKIIPYKCYNNEYDSVINNYLSDFYAYKNILLGENNILTSTGSDHFYYNIIVGNNNVSKTNTSYWWNVIFGSDNNINNNGHAWVLCNGFSNTFDIGINQANYVTILGGGNEISGNAVSTTTYPTVIGAYNKIYSPYQNSQSIIGYNNTLYISESISCSWYYNGNQRTYSGRDDYGRYGAHITGASNEVYGGTTLCSGYYNKIYKDIGLNLSQNFTSFINENELIWTSQNVLGSVNEATGTINTFGKYNVTKGMSTVIGERNHCNVNNNDYYYYWGNMPWEDSDNKHIIRAGILIGSANQIEGCEMVLGNWNNLGNAKLVVGSNNTTSNNSGDNYHATVFGCNNTLTTAELIVGSRNNCQNGVGTVFGCDNTVTGMNSTGYIIGRNNTASYGAGNIYGSDNSVQGGGSCYGNNNIVQWGSFVLGNNNSTIGGGGHLIIGTNNTTDSGGCTLIGCYLTTGSNAGSPVIIGKNNEPPTYGGVQLILGDGGSESQRNTLMYSDFDHNAHFSNNVFATNLPDAPNTAGTYTLQCTVTVVDNVVTKTYGWV